MSLPTGKLQRIALGAVILLIVAGISSSLLMTQPDPGTTLLPITEVGEPADVQIERVLPGLPLPINTPEYPGLDSDGVAPALIWADDGSAGDSAKLELLEGELPSPRGGPGEVASFRDIADLVVRDAGGNIKRQETVD